MAWRSFIGFQSCSTKMTVSAPVWGEQERGQHVEELQKDAATHEVESESTDVRREEEAVDRRVRVERLDDGVALRDVCRAVHAHVRDGRHRGAEEVVLDDVEHLLELAEEDRKSVV